MESNRTIKYFLGYQVFGLSNERENSLNINLLLNTILFLNIMYNLVKNIKNCSTRSLQMTPTSASLYTYTSMRN